ncbi:hypothetical protein [Streptomyces sp. NPDC012746]|uniref:hypothetical protein n=1 Tax=Streptomyces sp. NPDC012746 TaxID=3364845 RepID=UPI0036AC0991
MAFVNHLGTREKAKAEADYEALLDSEVARHGGCSARIEAMPRARGFATLMHSVYATPFRRQRLRMTAWVKARRRSPTSYVVPDGSVHRLPR